MPQTTAVTNIAAYKFARLTDLKELRERLLSQCKAWGLKGTVLLSTEGVNLFVAGESDSIELLMKELRAVPGLESLQPKYSLSEEQPFSRMLVRIKKEIITFGVEGIDPGQHTSPKLKPQELKRWLDEGRPVTLLDTRNDYEIKLGTFEGAVTVGIDHFRHFPEAVARLPEEMKEQPVVMFCTGGIRCEKAGPFMEREGFKQIFQLDGGILKYFEDCGGAHYNGECFVFDHRVGVDHSLQETDSTFCFNCLTPLDPIEQRHPRYEVGKSCQYCYHRTAEHLAEALAKRQLALNAAGAKLSGSHPYDNLRPLNIPASCKGKTLLEALVMIFPHLPTEELTRYMDKGWFLDFEGHAVPAHRIVRAGERFNRLIPGLIEPEVNTDIRLLYEDEAILVLHKPAPLPMHPCGRFNRHTLQSLLNEIFHPEKLRPAHRLDANTTGVAVFARTKHFATKLVPQFAEGTVDKVYLVQVLGQPKEDEFECDARIATERGAAGSRVIDEDDGQDARTEFNVVRRNADGTALLEARPRTGRTNQIRTHLWHLGFPVCGDSTYLPNQELGATQTLEVEDTPLKLHAWKLTFRHPLTDETMTFTAEEPEWTK